MTEMQAGGDVKATQTSCHATAAKIASGIVAEIEALPVRNTPNIRAVRRNYSRTLKQEAPEFILHLAARLLENPRRRWFAYELVQNHRPAFRSVGETELEALGRGISGWGPVDAFARILAGPAWLHEQVSDALMDKWARSEDRWWRRAALVSTVALNVRSYGGNGDARRTLRICRLLVSDHDDTVVKAMSWALRALVVHDPEAVERFLATHSSAIAARIKREVRNKLTTGRKNPKPRRG